MLNNLMMHILVFSTILLVGYCTPLSKDSDATILHYNYTNDGKGNYNYRFETTNGIIREESGEVVGMGLPNEYMFIKGLYSYINPDGILVTVNYIADDKGYRIIKQPSFNTNIVYSSITPNVLATLLGK